MPLDLAIPQGQITTLVDLVALRDVQPRRSCDRDHAAAGFCFKEPHYYSPRV